MTVIGTMVAVLLSLWSVAASASGATPALDPTFGIGGVVSMPGSDTVSEVVALPNGSVVAASTREVLRFTSAGTMEALCSPTEGIVGIQHDGKAIVVAVSGGTSVFAGTATIGRLTEQCGADSSFQVSTLSWVGGSPIIRAVDDWQGGIYVRLNVYGLSMSQGKANRVSMDGTLTTYEADLAGIYTAVLAAPGGRMVAISRYRPPYNFCDPCVPVTSIQRFTRDGSTDPSFGHGTALRIDGFAAYDALPNPVGLPYQVAVLDSAGAVWLAGWRQADNRSHVVRVTPVGALDLGFGDQGFVAMPGLVQGMVLQPDGKVLVGVVGVTGSILPTGQSALVRILPTGQFDRTFGNAGVALLPLNVRPAAITSDGKLLLAGNGETFVLARMTIGPADAIEFHHAAFDHYFLTMNAQEVLDLDMAVHPGWARTGASFKVYGSSDVAPAATNPVCRYYIPPEHGDSHFFSASPDECRDVALRVATDPNYSGYVMERSSAFFVALPDLGSGACAAGTIPVYRLWNGRADSNHRYTTNLLTVALTKSSGYVSEGYGPNGVAMCAAAE